LTQCETRSRTSLKQKRRAPGQRRRAIGTIKGKAVSSTSSSAGTGQAGTKNARPRPLSPHLSVYRFIPTMVASILHRATGAALYFGTLLIAWWLVAAAAGPGAFAWANGFLSSWFGLLILFGYTWVLMHHMLGGVRHFLWDIGLFDSKPVSTRLAYATFVGSAALTVLIWLIALIAR